jgi:cytochrome c peroxidase
MKKLILILTASSALSACALDTLSAEEHQRLAEMTLPRTLPASPGNTYADNADAAKLGQQFFFDRRFSGKLLESSDEANGGLGPAGTSGRVACATCHEPGNGGADRRQLGGTSLASAWTVRNSPTVLNATFSTWMFWDGRRDSLWSQALAPVENPAEHNFSRLEVVHVINDHYREPYERVFGTLPPMNDFARFPRVGKPGMSAWEGMTDDDRLAINRVFANFGKALEAYERLLVDRSSPFDRYMAGDPLAMSDAAIRGAKLFVGRAACNECHSGPMLADNEFHNHGVPQIGTKVLMTDTGRQGGIDAVLAAEFNMASSYADSPRPEMLTSLRKDPETLGAFKTPSLRNVGKTGPYMHTGAFSSLWDVVLWYNDAAGTDGFVGTRSAASVVPLRLSMEDVGDVVEFMRALDGDKLPDELVSAPALP